MVALFSQGGLGRSDPLYLRPGTNLMASGTGVPITGTRRRDVEGPLRDGTVPATAGDAKVRDALLRWIEAQGMLREEVIRVMTDTPASTAGRASGAQEDDLLPRPDADRRGARGWSRAIRPAEPVQLRMGALIIGSTAPASVNAELYLAIARRLRERSPLTTRRDGDARQRPRGVRIRSRRCILRALHVPGERLPARARMCRRCDCERPRRHARRAEVATTGCQGARCQSAKVPGARVRECQVPGAGC